MAVIITAEGLTSNSPLVYFASGTLTISSSLTSGIPYSKKKPNEIGAVKTLNQNLFLPTM